MTIYWDLMKRNNQSVQETEHVLHHYSPVIQSLGKRSRSDVWFRNESFFWTGSFSWTSWTRFTESSETVHGSDLLVTRTNSLLDASDSHSDSKWAEIAAYLILWWMNWCRAPVPLTVTELSKPFDSNRRPVSCWQGRTGHLEPAVQCGPAHCLNMWPWTTKPVLSPTGIFVAIAKNTLYGSKLLIFLLCQK